MHEIELRDKFLFYTSDDNETNIYVRVEDDTIWVTQKSMAEIFDVEVHTVNYHLKEIFKSGELAESSVIRIFRITANDSKVLKEYLIKGFAMDDQRLKQGKAPFYSY